MYIYIYIKTYGNAFFKICLVIILNTRESPRDVQGQYHGGQRKRKTNEPFISEIIKKDTKCSKIFIREVKTTVQRVSL